MPDALDFSLADFHYNDNPNVLLPPEDFDAWMDDPRVKEGYTFFEQELLQAPRSVTTIRSKIDGRERKIINMTSYNYLGLSTHPEVLEAAKASIDRYGMGSSGAPLLSGTLDLHTNFARKLAEFKGKDDCIVFSSGYGANVGALQGVMRKGDVIIFDEKSHKSLVDGGVLSGAKMVFFAHNDSKSLEEALEKAKGKRTLVVVEGVYSMDGDLADLPSITALTESYGAGLYVDEAHSTLMFGESGRGVGEHFGLEDKIGVSFGTLSKSFGGVGGFVCANARLIRYLKGYASAWNFSCAPSPPVVAGLTKALEVATRDDTLRKALWDNVTYFRASLDRMGLNTGKSESQVIPIIIGPSGELLFRFAAELQTRGLFLQPVDYPAVPAHERRFRISMSSQFTRDDLDEALNIINDVIAQGLKKAGVTPGDA